MADKPSLLEIVSNSRPEAAAEAYIIGGSLVVCFHDRFRKVWVSLDGHSRVEGIEKILGLVANMLVCCRDCRNNPAMACRQEFNLVSQRLRKLLGEPSYEQFLAGAPIRSAAKVRAESSADKA